MLPGPSGFWLTGCSAASPGHFPFCASASISVPGAPASSLLTGSQPLASKPGAEICAPDCVATALLCTCQPRAPRSVMSLAPVATGAGARRTAAAAAGLPGVRGTSTTRAAAAAMHVNWARRRRAVFMAGSCPTAAWPRRQFNPPIVRILS